MLTKLVIITQRNVFLWKWWFFLNKQKYNKRAQKVKTLVWKQICIGLLTGNQGWEPSFPNLLIGKPQMKPIVSLIFCYTVSFGKISWFITKCDEFITWLKAAKIY